MFWEKDVKEIYVNIKFKQEGSVDLHTYGWMDKVIIRGRFVTETPEVLVPDWEGWEKDVKGKHVSNTVK